MTDICSLKFEVICYVAAEDADDLGSDLATFLQESWFNGEDVLEVHYVGHEVRT